MTVRLKTVALLLLWALIAPERIHAGGQTLRTCSISDAASLRSCFAGPGNYDRFVITGDLKCTSDSDCCPNGRAPMLFRDVSDREIDGNGHTFHREAGQHVCPVIAMRRALGIRVKNLTLDEDRRAPPCELSERSCPSTIDIAAAKNVQLENVRIYAGKGYVVKVWATNGFTFSHSATYEAGIIGLYVGHYKFGASTNIIITDSVFARSRTNAVALQGASTSDPAHPVLVTKNVFMDNHWHGLWPIPGGVTTGGQLLIGDGENIRITGNIITGRPCENCYKSRHVSGIEIGDVAPAPSGVRGLLIHDNTMMGTDEAGSAIHQNPASFVSDVAISDNRITGYDRLDDIITNTKREQNAVEPQQSVPSSVGVAGFARSPSPGAPANPEFLCTRKDDPQQHFISLAKDCDGNGRVRAVLGFPTSSNRSGLEVRGGTIERAR